MTTSERLIRPYEPLYCSLKTSRVYRWIMTGLSFFIFLWGLTVYRGLNNIFFVSHIGGLLVFIYYAVALFHSVSDKKENSIATRVLTAVFQLTISVQFMIFIFYWFLLSYPDIERIYSNPSRAAASKEFLVMLFHHMVYPVATWFTLFTERTTFTGKNIRVVVGFALFYIVLNGSATIMTGVPVYDVVDWKGIVSHIHLGLGLGLVFAGFFLSLKISNLINVALGFPVADKTE
jgi:hypothetical protein